VPPPPACHSCLPISSSVSGANLYFTKICLGFGNISDPENSRIWICQHPGRTVRFQRRTGGCLDNSNCFCGPWGYTLKSGYLIFLRIVMMNRQNRHDTQQGFEELIIPAQQRSTSLASHRSSQDFLPRHHRYFYLQIGRGAKLQDTPTTKVEIISNRLLKVVACTLLII
jgi:hypothetical protein